MSGIHIVTAILLALFSSQLMPTATAQASHPWNWRCNQGQVVDFWGGAIEGSELAGRGAVCTTPLGLWSTMTVSGLTAGNAYTVWWVYIDNPDACAGSPLPAPDVIPFPEPPGFAEACGLADFFTEDESGQFLNPLAVFGRMDSIVAGNSARVRFGGDLRGFAPSPGSQIWMFVFGHGPAAIDDKRELARQLLTPEDPNAGAPHLGIQGRPFGYPAGVVVVEM